MIEAITATLPRFVYQRFWAGRFAAIKSNNNNNNNNTTSIAIMVNRTKVVGTTFT